MNFFISLLSEEGSKEISSKRTIAVFIVAGMLFTMIMVGLQKMIAPPEYMYEWMAYIAVACIFGSSIPKILEFMPRRNQTKTEITSNTTITEKAPEHASQ